MILAAQRSFAKLISDANHLHHRPRPSPAPGARPGSRGGCARQAGGDLSPTQGAALATIDCHGPLTPSELAARETHPAPDRHARARAAGGGGPGRAHRRSRRSPLEPRRPSPPPAARCSRPCASARTPTWLERLDRLSPTTSPRSTAPPDILERVLEPSDRQRRAHVLLAERPQLPPLLHRPDRSRSPATGCRSSARCG